MTPAQRMALHRYWPDYGVEVDGLLDLERLFARRAPHYLEIGFGMGDMLIDMAMNHIERDYLGIETYDPGIGRLLGQIHKLGIGNIRVIRGDANEVLPQCLADHSLDGVYLFFPDPWPKRRHHKRRLVGQQFAALVSAKLRPRGFWHIATDVEDYAEHMLDVLQRETTLRNLAQDGTFSPRPVDWPMSKFELRGLARGHSTWHLLFARRG